MSDRLWIEDDAYGDATLWQGDGEYPALIVRKGNVHPVAWRLIVDAVERQGQGTIRIDGKDVPMDETVSVVEAERDLLASKVAEVDAAREAAENGHELMASQFRVMQAEKEHGWREAEKWEDRAEVAERDRNGYMQLAWCLLTLLGGEARISDAMGREMPDQPAFVRYYDPATSETVILPDSQPPAGQETERDS